MLKHEHKDIDFITDWLKWNIFRNEKIMWADLPAVEINGREYDLVDVIATLHNMLHEALTGEPYDYMWHHANKIGSWTFDDLFDADPKSAHEED